MRSIIILGLAIMLMITHSSIAQQNHGGQFTISGAVTGRTDSVILNFREANDKYTVLTQPVKDGKFTLSGKIMQPGSAGVFFKRTTEMVSDDEMESRRREVYLEPSAMTLTGDADDPASLHLKGSTAENDFLELEAQTAPIRAEMKQLDDALDKERDHEKAAAIREKLEPYNDRIKKTEYQFFITHPNSWVTLQLMRFDVEQMRLDSGKKVYNAFNDELKATDDGKKIAETIEKTEAGMPGRIAAAFTKTDIHGGQLSLNDFKGKYVMLDFWASWCVPCRKGNPHMIGLYKKYQSKGFEIIGIADDDGKIAVWKAAVEKDQVGIWHHVLRGLDWSKLRNHIPNPDDLDEIYGIHSIPTKILIGPDGKIIGRFGDAFGGSDADMDKMLVSIFDK